MRSLLILIATGLVFTASPAAAQDRQVCFEPGTTVMTTEGFVSAREAAVAALEAPGGPGSPNSVEIVNHAPPPTVHGAPSRAMEVKIELLRNGLPLSRMKVVRESGGEADCLTLRPLANFFMIVEDEYLLYFDRDSDVVFPTWTSYGAQLMAVGYRPGERFLVIDAHAEEVERDPVGLSRRRGDSIARHLLRAGVRWEDIVIRAHGTRGGMARPVPQGVSEPLNRRAIVAMRRHRPASID